MLAENKNIYLMYWKINKIYMGQFLQGGKNGRSMSFLDALASLDFKLSVSQSVSDLPFFKLSVIPVIPVFPISQVIPVIPVRRSVR